MSEPKETREPGALDPETMRLQDIIRRLKAAVRALAQERQMLKAEYDAFVAEFDSIAEASVICGDHFHGLAAESVDGSNACPWCLAADRLAAMGQLENEIAVLDSENVNRAETIRLLQESNKVLQKRVDDQSALLAATSAGTCRALTR